MMARGGYERGMSRYNQGYTPPRAPYRAPRPRVPITERKSTVFAVTGALTVGLGMIGLPSLFSWLETRDTKAIEVPPPTGRVDHYAALITGTASSTFPINGKKECTTGSVKIEDEWAAKATVANEIGDFVVRVSADQTQVTIDLNQFPELKSGIKMDQSRTSISSGWSLCTGKNAVDLSIDMMRTAQATADTIGDCIVKREDFQESLRDQLADVGHHAYPNATVTVNIPGPDGTPSEAITALDTLRQELSQHGVTIESGPIDNCEFKEFKMVPIVFTEGE